MIVWVIVWVNGAFGVGKTSTANQLVGILPRARVFDPERLGWVLQRTVARLQPGDFQHLAPWNGGFHSPGGAPSCHRVGANVCAASGLP